LEGRNERVEFCGLVTRQPWSAADRLTMRPSVELGGPKRRSGSVATSTPSKASLNGEPASSRPRLRDRNPAEARATLSSTLQDDPARHAGVAALRLKAPPATRPCHHLTCAPTPSGARAVSARLPLCVTQLVPSARSSWYGSGRLTHQLRHLRDPRAVSPPTSHPLRLRQSCS